MYAYLGTKKDFISILKEPYGNITLADEIRKNVESMTGKLPSDEEYDSWSNSLPYMKNILNDDAIPENTEIGLEYQIPETSYRVDFMISGYDSENKANVIIVELKQWETAEDVPNEDCIVSTFIDGEKQNVNHPSYQAYQYSVLINDFNQAIDDGNITISPCVYMHNYKRQPESDPLFDDKYKNWIEKAPIFTKNEEGEFRDFIKGHIATGGDILHSIDTGRHKPSKSLQTSFINIVQNNQEFTLVDDQKVVYEDILDHINQSLDNQKKSVIIVPGGPGTGKSVIALNLLAYLYNKGNGDKYKYTSKNASPRTFYTKEVGTYGEKETSIKLKTLIKYSGFFTGKNENEYDVILTDESHRLIEEKNGKSEIDAIINAGLCSVFFVDDKQIVTTDDIAVQESIKAKETTTTIDLIKKSAKNIDVYITKELKTQFRCGGSNGYLDWLDNTLEIKNTPVDNLKDIDYDFRVIDSPQELREMIIQKNNDKDRVAGSRLVAGYCWEWPSYSISNPNKMDITIGDFEMSWNLRYSGYSYLFDENSIDQVGCIHTVQGLDLDYVGVIIGDDMKYENGKIITDRNERALTDESLKDIKDTPNPDKLADEIIKNTYRVLMTRGMKGCYVYCTNKELSEYIKQASKNVFQKN